jgi:3alpha(or 20beta)-hydroxysteroid dehydrogenase
MRLAGKIALVTGGAMGIGSGIVRRFAAEGADVAICDLADERGLALAAELGGGARFFRLDVTDRNAWDRVVAQIEAEMGPLDIVVNNAGIGALTYVETMTMADFERVIAVNLNGVLFGMQATIPSLRKAGNGVILNVSSLQGIEADVGLTAYVATKFAVRGITKSAALELGREGIRANSIHPGMIRTPALHEDALPDDFFGAVPLRRTDRKDRAGYPEDVGNLAVFLASDEASYVTGAEFVIDGGKSVRFATPGRAEGSFA